MLLDRRAFVTACLGPLLARWMPEPEPTGITRERICEMFNVNPKILENHDPGSYLLPPCAIDVQAAAASISRLIELMERSFDPECSTGYTNTP